MAISAASRSSSAAYAAVLFLHFRDARGDGLHAALTTVLFGLPLGDAADERQHRFAEGFRLGLLGIQLLLGVREFLPAQFLIGEKLLLLLAQLGKLHLELCAQGLLPGLLRLQVQILAFEALEKAVECLVRSSATRFFSSTRCTFSRC